MIQQHLWWGRTHLLTSRVPLATIVDQRFFCLYCTVQWLWIFAVISSTRFGRDLGPPIVFQLSDFVLQSPFYFPKCLLCSNLCWTITAEKLLVQPVFLIQEFGDCSIIFIKTVSAFCLLNTKYINRHCVYSCFNCSQGPPTSMLSNIFLRASRISDLCNLDTSIRFGTPVALTFLLIQIFSLPRTRFWCVLRSTPRITCTVQTSRRSRFRVMIQSKMCPCFDLGCIHAILYMTFCW